MSIIFKGADRIRRISWGMILLLSVLSLWSCSDDDDADERSGWVLPMKVTYRYFKVTLDAWASGGNTMQISEFNIGKMNFIANE